MQKKLVLISLVICIVVGSIIVFSFKQVFNEPLNNPATVYTPKTSGPFSIKDNELLIHQNLFLIVNELEPKDKGNVVFISPKNKIYMELPFDGAVKSSWSKHFVPDFSRSAGICDLDDLVGEWKVVFQGTEYEPIEFTILEEQVLTEAETSGREDGGLNPLRDFYSKPVC